MKKLLGTVICAAAIGWAGTAAATSVCTVGCTYYEEDTEFVWFDRNYRSHTWTFDLDNDDLFAVGPSGPTSTPVDIGPEDDIISALLGIGFVDDERDRRREEFAALRVDRFRMFRREEIDTAFYTYDVLGHVINDHTLSVTVNRRRGDFGVYHMSLGGTFMDNPGGSPVPTPEPATMLLFGSGLAALGAYRKKKQS